MILPATFYRRPTLDVATDLIGKVLVRKFGPRSRDIVSGIIVETEAYIGETDLACHAARGRTARTEVMYGPPGRAYVYLIYGMYCCLNAVTEEAGTPAAVLIRAVEPLDGTSRMALNRGGCARTTDIGSGPGKLCQAMAIDRALNQADLRGPHLWIEDRAVDPGPIRTSARIGVEYAGAYRDKPWRLFVDGNAHVSKRPSRNKRRKS